MLDCKEASPRGTDDDEADLAAMGYKQELYRGFSGLTAFAFCFTSVGIIPSICLNFKQSLQLGGPAEIVWAWVVGSVFCVISGLSMAEISSVYPSAGSVYHWAGQMAPLEFAPLASYVTGWFNILGNTAADASIASGFASSLSYAINISYPDVQLTTNAQVALSVVVMALWTVLNATRVDFQGLVYNVALVFMIVGSVVIVVVILAMSPQWATPDYVFTSVNDQTGLSNNPKVLSPFTAILGLSSCVFTFTGFESCAHMAEETHDARTSAPWGIAGTVLCCATFGLMFNLGMLFATPDITAFQNPVQEIFKQTAGRDGGTVLMMILVVMFFFGGLSSITVTSRIFYAMARDGALPYSEYLAFVSDGTKTPMQALVTVCVVNCVLLLLPLVNSNALSAFTRTCTVGFQMSYTIPILFRITSARKSWIPGKWNLGSYSIPFACIAVIWQLAISFLPFLPISYPVTLSNMNWTIVVVLLTATVASITWLTSARHHFVGPRRQEYGLENAIRLEPSIHRYS
jgi:amino acid transporter